jgi:hypothetical protein
MFLEWVENDLMELGKYKYASGAVCSMVPV